MRLHTMLLLLLNALDVADAAGNCETKWIKVPPTTEFTFAGGSGQELTCNGNQEIVVDGNVGNRYAKLKCKDLGWEHSLDGNSFTAFAPKKAANKDIKIECKAKAPATNCALEHITGDPPGEYVFPGGSGKELTCNGNKEIVVDGERYAKLKCKDLGWEHSKDGNTFTAFTTNKKADEKINIACKAKACDKSLITDFEKNKLFTYSPTNELKCKQPYQLIGYTDSNSAQKKSPTAVCNPAGNWKAGGQDTGLKSTERVAFGCEVIPCHTGLITLIGVTNNGQSLTCGGGQKVQIDGNPQWTADTFTCANSGWTGVGAVGTPKKSTEQFTVTCVAAASPSTTCTVTDTVAVEINSDGAGSFTATCRATLGPNFKLFYGTTPTDREVKDVTCTPAKGWKAGPTEELQGDSATPLPLTCKAPPPAPKCTVTPTGATDYNDNTLTCTPSSPPGSPKAIITGGKPYTLLKCDDTTGKWNDANGDLVASANTPLAVTCVEYCTTTGGVAPLLSSTDSSTFTAACASPIYALRHGTEPTAKPVKGVTCSLAEGWKDEEGVIPGSTAATTALPLECKKGCRGFKHLVYIHAPNQPPRLTDGLSPDVTMPPDTETVIRCKQEETSMDENAKNAMKLNDKFVFSHLYCNAEKGFFDVTDATLEADAFADVTITCERSLCPKRNAKVCSHINDKLPKGYNCEYDDSKVFEKTDDPNLLNCNKADAKTGKKHVIFSGKTKAFYSKPLRCGKNAKWYEIDKGETEGVVQSDSEDNELFCVERTCNQCKHDYNMANYKAGTADDCATVKCDKNLWKVKKMGGVEEEYAGEVECSSDKATAGKWVIDGKDVIESASCIDTSSVTAIKCTVASALVTTCDAAYSTFGCTELTTLLTDDGKTATCTAGKMFYKQRDAYNFEEGPDKIECNPKDGVWKLTGTGVTAPVVLKRGGTVICADSNPAPTTTTTQPTTTTVYQDVCSLCTSPEKKHYNCATCISPYKKTEFNLHPDGNNADKCVAENYLHSPFETENAGTVEQKLLYCLRSTNSTWRTDEIEDVGKFAIRKKHTDEDAEGKLGLIVGGATGGVVLLIIIFVVIFKVLTSRKKPDDRDEETKRKMLEESKKKKKRKNGDNDEILDEQSVDAPSELKL